MWLVVAIEDRAVDLKRLGEVLGAGWLSFGSPERLRRHLGVEPGSVTPLALINDESRERAARFDRGLMDGGRSTSTPRQHHDDGDDGGRPVALLRRHRSPAALARLSSFDVIL